MGAADAVLWALERNWDMVAGALEGLDDATMNRRPGEHSNSIAWIFLAHEPGGGYLHQCPVAVRAPAMGRRRLEPKILPNGLDGWE